MGERTFERKALSQAVVEGLAEPGCSGGEQRLNTPGGRFQVRWDEGGSATALGQLEFFAEFLEVSGLFKRWVPEVSFALYQPQRTDGHRCAGYLVAVHS